MSGPRTPKRDREHRTTVTETSAGYVWTCSCGDYYFAASTYRVASAGATVHRHYMKELRENASRESRSCVNLGARWVW